MDRWKRQHRVRHGKGCRVSEPSQSTPFSPNLHVPTNLEALQILSSGSSQWLHYIAMTD